MLNIFKKYKLILINKDESSVKEVSSQNISFLFILISISLILFLSILFFSNDLNDFITMKSIQSHKNDNKKLQSIINNQTNEISSLLDEIDKLNVKDNNLRRLLKLPEINNDVRKLGVGGSSKNKNDIFNDLDYLLPKNNDLNNLKNKINFLQRSINLGKLSYSEIEDKATSETNYFTHFPAIKPVSLKNSKLTSGYGYRYDPFTNKRKMHEGDDFSAKRGTEVVSTADGTIQLAADLLLSGNTVIVDHGHGISSTYLHMKEISVSSAQFVRRGELIGYVGSTGRSTGAHLDWRINWFHKRIDPQRALAIFGLKEEQH